MRARLRKKLAKQRTARLRFHPDAFKIMGALLDAPSLTPRVVIYGIGYRRSPERAQ